MTIYRKPHFVEVSECDDDFWTIVGMRWPIKPKTFVHWVEVNVRNLEFVDPDDMVWTADITICLPSFDLEQRLYIFIDGAELSTERGRDIFADHNGPVRLRLVEGDDDTLLAESVMDDCFFETIIDMNEAVSDCVRLTEESYGDY